MLKIYWKHVRWERNGKFIAGEGWRVMLDENEVPEPTSVEVTWDNLSDVYQSYALLCPFNIWHFKKGRRISFWDCSLFDKNTWDIKEWKTSSTGIVVETSYEEDKYVPLKEIMNFDADLALQYLVERGINPTSLVGS